MLYLKSMDYKVTIMVAFMLEGGMSMASDDMFRIIYCILKELYECKKKGIRRYRV